MGLSQYRDFGITVNSGLLISRLQKLDFNSNWDFGIITISRFRDYGIEISGITGLRFQDYGEFNYWDFVGGISRFRIEILGLLISRLQKLDFNSNSTIWDFGIFNIEISWRIIYGSFLIFYLNSDGFLFKFRWIF